MQKYEVITDGGIDVNNETLPQGSLVELESAAEETLAFLEQGLIKIYEEVIEPKNITEPDPSKPSVAPTNTQEPAPVTPSKPAVAPTVADKIIAETVANYPTPPAPFESMNPMLYAFCKAIEAHEVCVAPGQDPKYPAGTRSYFDKNPGNLKFRNQENTIGEDKDGFAIFDTVDNGFIALSNQVLIAARGTSGIYKNPLWDANLKAWRQMNFLDFFKIYDSSYGDDPVAYANDVAKALDVSPETTLNHLL